MSNTKNEVMTGGVSIPMVLFLIFIVLKLCGIITWSWWWVTAPLWGGIALILGILLIFLLIMGIASLIRIFM